MESGEKINYALSDDAVQSPGLASREAPIADFSVLLFCFDRPVQRGCHETLMTAGSGQLRSVCDGTLSRPLAVPAGSADAARQLRAGCRSLCASRALTQAGVSAEPRRPEPGLNLPAVTSMNPPAPQNLCPMGLELYYFQFDTLKFERLRDPSKLTDRMG